MPKRKKKEVNQESNCFFVSRDKLCALSLSAEKEDVGKCGLPYTHEYEDSYTIVYRTSHLKTNRYDCGCITYHNQHFHEFKFPEVIWMDFFQEGVEMGEKNIKFTIRKCHKK